MNPSCEFCGKTIVGPVYERAAGWAKQRTGGGTNALRGRVTYDRFACRWCLDLVDRGVDPRKQAVLFD